MSNQNKKNKQSESLRRYVRELGIVPGPIKPDGQTTFCLALGLFDEDDNQVVHTKENGVQTPIILLSYPIDTDELPNSGLIVLGSQNRIIN